MKTNNTPGMTRWAISRKGFMIGSAAAAALVAVATHFPGSRILTESLGRSSWYEVVQDMKEDGKWHVNLYRGPQAGNLATGVLVKHSTLQSDPGAIKRNLEHPWRIQYSNGHQEQTI